MKKVDDISNKTEKKEFDFVTSNGRIVESKLFQFLYPSVKPVRDRSVIKPLAPNANLCSQGSSLNDDLKTLYTLLNKIKIEEPVIYYICEIMLAGSCRISEVLDIRYNDFKSTNQLLIRGKKGSSNRIISVSESRQYLRTCKEVQKDPFNDYNRFYVYRRLKYYGIGGQFEGKNKMAITHYFRQLSLRILENEEVTKEDRMRQSGHKSKNSLTYYERNKI